MKNFIETIKSAKVEGFRFFGIRVVPEIVTVGQQLAPSHDWDMENDCPSADLLPGTCALWLDVDGLLYDDEQEVEANIEDAIKRSEVYDGPMTVLVGSKTGYEDGWDVGEVILEDATVLAMVK